MTPTCVVSLGVYLRGGRRRPVAVWAIIFLQFGTPVHAQKSKIIIIMMMITLSDRQRKSVGITLGQNDRMIVPLTLDIPKI